MSKYNIPLDALPQELSEVVSWIQEICRLGKADDYILCDDNPTSDLYHFRFFTKENKYSIAVRPYGVTHTRTANGKAVEAHNNPSYIGATVQTRKPRAGEDWNRGNDLPDGEYSRETWDKIKNAIIAYEMVKVSKQARSEYPEPKVTPGLLETPDDLKEDLNKD